MAAAAAAAARAAAESKMIKENYSICRGARGSGEYSSPLEKWTDCENPLNYWPCSVLLPPTTTAAAAACASVPASESPF